MEIIFFPDRGSNPGRLRDRPTLYRVAIKAGLYRKAVQMYHIPIPAGLVNITSSSPMELVCIDFFHWGGRGDVYEASSFRWCSFSSDTSPTTSYFLCYKLVTDLKTGSFFGIGPGIGLTTTGNIIYEKYIISQKYALTASQKSIDLICLK